MRTPLVSLSHLPKVLAKMEDDRAKVQDLLEEIDLGTPDNPKPFFLASYFWLKLEWLSLHC